MMACIISARKECEANTRHFALVDLKSVSGEWHARIIVMRERAGGALVAGA